MADKSRFSSSDWEEIVSIISSAFAMDDARRARLFANATAKLIAAIPYLAGCRESERTALAHVATYVIAGSEAGRKAFDHKSNDDYDIFARLATGAGFEGGDPAIINKGMKILASIMIEGYRRDRASDKAKGLYNPVGAGVWNADERLSALKLSIAAVEDEEMDAIAEEIGVKGGWWQIS
jgi:hypothetical protein